MPPITVYVTTVTPIMIVVMCSGQPRMTESTIAGA